MNAMKNIIKDEINEGIIEKKLKAGEYIEITLDRAGRNSMVASGTGMINVIDVAINGLKSPRFFHIMSPEFSKTYGVELGTHIVIDMDNYHKDNVLLVRHGRLYKVAEYHNDKLIDVKEKSEIPNGENDDTKIIGAIYKKIERWFSVPIL